MNRRTHKSAKKPPLLWTGGLFGLAANLFLVTVADSLVELLQMDSRFAGMAGLIAVLIGALLAGVFTGLYVRQRAGIHAFIGGMLSIPILGLFIIPARWQTALLCGALCTLGGVISELVTRRRVLK